MALNFPADPENGQVYQNYTYDSAKGVWKKIVANLNSLSDVDAASPSDGDIIVYTTDGNSWVNEPLSSDIVPEGTTNLYYTDSKVDSVIDGKTTDDIDEGTTNLYYTDERVETVISNSDTDDLSEGTTNLYFTDQRVETVIGNSDTDDLSEGTTNLYFTEQRAIDATASSYDAVGSASTAESNANTYTDNAIGELDTDDISEGTTNLYFTDQRAIDAVKDNIELDDLSDVDISGVSDGDALVFDTSANSWVPGSVAIDALNDINDVNITEPANGEVLVYSDGDWVNQEASGGGIKDIVTSTTGLTFSAEDENNLIQIDSSSDTDIIIPVQSSVPIPVKTQVNIVRAGDGEVGIKSEQVVVGFQDVINPEQSAVTWSTQTSALTTPINSIAYGQNLFVAVAGNWQGGGLQTSTDTINWTSQNTHFNSSIEDVAYGDGLWMAVGGSYAAALSTDGLTWTSTGNIFSFGNEEEGIAFSVAYGNGIWMVGGAYGQLTTSTDTINWVTQTSNFSTTMRINSITYAENLWVAGGGTWQGGQLRTSVDTINWVTQTLNIPEINSISYANGIWVAGGGYEDGGLATSTNGINWVSQSAFSNFPVGSVINGDGIWVAGGTFGQLSTSTDALNWVTRTSNIGDVRAAAYGDGLWVVGGDQGQIRTSTSTFDQIDAFGDGVSINSSAGLKLREKWSVATAIKTGEDEWLITGDLSE